MSENEKIGGGNKMQPYVPAGNGEKSGEYTNKTYSLNQLTILFPPKLRLEAKKNIVLLKMPEKDVISTILNLFKASLILLNVDKPHQSRLSTSQIRLWRKLLVDMSFLKGTIIKKDMLI